MGVLDDAIREHLELKRKHGATDDEITRESQEALGPPRRERPRTEEPGDGAGETATAVDVGESGSAVEPSDAAEGGRPGDDDELFADMPGREAARADIPAAAEGSDTEPPSAPTPFDAEEPPPASRSEAERGGDPAPPPGPVLPEQGGNGAQGPAGTSPAEPGSADAPHEAERPIPDPTAAPPESGGDPDATMLYEAVGETAPDAEVPAPPGPATPEPPGAPEPPAPAEPPVPSEPPAPPEPEEPGDQGPPEPADEQPRDEGEPGPAGEDVLEDTPEFLQETPEDERLWFEQKPPRDFDFDD